MKKLVSIILTTILTASALTGCGGNAASSGAAVSTPASPAASSAATTKKIVVGASPAPHAAILKVAGEVLKEKGIELEVREFSDYVQPNIGLENKELDANYFQHKPYLDNFNQEKGTHLVSIGAIHYEPFGIYAGKTKDLKKLPDGATIAVPNDTTNEARALLLLQAQGLIKIKKDAGLAATQKDITENTKNLKIKEIEAAQLVRALPDVDLAVINGNFAIDGGLKVSDALAVEAADSAAAQTYANILAICEGDENRPELKALVEALKSDKVKKYIKDTYNGAVVSSEDQPVLTENTASSQAK